MPQAVPGCFISEVPSPNQMITLKIGELFL